MTAIDPLDDGAHSTIIARAKELIADERQRIALHDLLADEIQRVNGVLAGEEFSVGAGWSEAAFGERIDRYNRTLAGLIGAHALLGYWGQDAHSRLAALAARRLADEAVAGNGLNTWLAMRWYPVSLLAYAEGIASLAARNYEQLSRVLLAPVPDRDSRSKSSCLAVAMVSGVQDVRDSFKSLPGRERQRTPMSEYLFDQLKPQFGDLLLLGTEYERCFDRFEVMLSLVHADQAQWGRLFGRFAWKQAGRGGEGPLQEVIAEANHLQCAWPPLRSGLFAGSYDRFQKVAETLAVNISKLNW